MFSIRALGLICIVLAGGCSDGVKHGAANFCFASTVDENEFSPLVREESRTGLQLLAPTAHLDAPQEFIDCAVGMSEMAEFTDDQGAHIWLSFDAHLDARDLIPRGLIALADGGSLAYIQVGGFVPFGSLLLSNTDGAPVLALEYGGRLKAFSAQGLTITEGPPTAFANVDACGSAAPTALNFDTDTESASVANGETFALTVDGREGRATNIFTVVRSISGGCSDTRDPGLDATWVYVDGSL